MFPPSSTTHVFTGDWWNGQLAEPDFYNVVMDLHRYDCYDNASRRNLGEHVEQEPTARNVASQTNSSLHDALQSPQS